MSTHLRFALATVADAPGIAAVRTAAAEELTRRYGQGSWSTGTSERHVVRQLSRPKFEKSVIACDGDQIAATLHLQTKKPWAIDISYFTPVDKALYLVGMAVHPEWQGKNAGRAILKEAERIAREWPAEAIRMDAWDAAAGAGPFYAKCGFREVGRAIYRTAPLVYYELLL